jgi:hypothetical protein
MQQIFDALDIDKRAIELKAMIIFLFKSDIETLIDNCAGKSNFYIGDYVYGYREKLIDNTRFESPEDFKDTYFADPIKTLERLFQEYITQDKFDKLSCKDPDIIYSKHVVNPKVRFNRFVRGFE